MPFSCKECGAEFKQLSNLKIATHPGEVDLFLLKVLGSISPKWTLQETCKHIQEQDFPRDNLKRRIQTYTAEGPSKCSSSFVELV